jgi:isopenicillin N synthase-like dioxygenase
LDLDCKTQASITAAYGEGRQFFDLPNDRKLPAQGPHGCGYRPYGVEHSGSSERPDRLESFTVAPGMAPSAAAPDADKLHAAMVKVFRLVEPLAETVMLRWARATGGASHIPRLRGGLRRWSALQMNCTLPSAETEFVSTVHDDMNLLTLCHALAPGLEAEDRAGTFFPVPNPASRLAILPGQVATLMSGGQIRAIRHRVRGGAPGRRFSLVFFGDLEPGRCRPWSNDPASPPVDIEELVRRSQAAFGLPPYPNDQEDGR